MDPIILKILNGVQSGVEVALADGTYAFGSGRDDDIQLVDVSLLAGHARLRIAGAKIDIAAQAGPLDLAGTRILEKDAGWHTLEPLDIVVAGTTRFALGPRSTNWASVANQGRRSDAAEAERIAPLAARPAARALDWRLLAAPVLALAVVALAVGWLFVRPGGFASGSRLSGADGVHALRESLDRFPFGRPVDVRDEVDGAIFATGYVATPVERRALVGAVDKTGVPARVRLYVLDDMRREIADLVTAQKSPVDFSLSDRGAVALTGVILSADRANALAASIRERVFGVSQVDLKIRTADAILNDTKDLLTAAQLNSWLLLRVVGDTLEVSGALPAEKVDAWAGFLQTYASRFAKDLPLRSFVQLQPSPGSRGTTVAARSSPIALGGAPVGGPATPLDIEKLRKGTFTLDDLFVGTHAADVGPSRRPDRPWAVARETAGPSRTDAQRSAEPSSSDGRSAIPFDRTAGPAGREGERIPATPRAAGDPLAAVQAVDRTGSPSRPAASGIAGDDAPRGGPGAALAGTNASLPGQAGGTAPSHGAPDAPRGGSGAALAGTNASLPSQGGSTAPRGESGASLAGVSVSEPARERRAVPSVGPLDAPAPERSAPNGQPASGPVSVAAVADRAPRSGMPRAGAAGPDVIDDASPRGRAYPAAAAPAAGTSGRPSAPDDPSLAASTPTSPREARDRTPVTDDASSAAPPEDGRPTVATALTGPPEAAPNAVPIDYLPASREGSDGQSAVADLRSQAAAAIMRFRAGGVPKDIAMRDIQVALALIESRENGAKVPARGGRPEADWLLPITSPRAEAPGAAQPCWSGTELTAADLVPTLFWLDVLSVTRTTSLKSFEERQRILLLDVALDPDAVRACGRSSPETVNAVEHSLYLREISRNPGFADFIMRDQPRSELDVVGVSLGKRRFVVTRDGVRYHEGSAPERTSRVALVGELGLVVQRSEGLAVQSYGPSIGWLVAN